MVLFFVSKERKKETEKTITSVLTAKCSIVVDIVHH